MSTERRVAEAALSGAEGHEVTAPEQRRRHAVGAILRLVAEALEDLRDTDFEEGSVGRKRAIYLAGLALDRQQIAWGGLPGEGVDSSRLARLVGLEDSVPESTPGIDARGAPQPAAREPLMRPRSSHGRPEAVNPPRPALVVRPAKAAAPEAARPRKRRPAVHSPAAVGKRARTEILGHEMLATADLARLLFASRTEPDRERGRRQVGRLQRTGVLLALPDRKRLLYPAFQVDRARGELYPEVEVVNALLGAAVDPWGAASWWMSPHARLGTAPSSLLGTPESGRLIDLARAIQDDGY